VRESGLAAIYKIMTVAEWEAFQAGGIFAGSPIDRADGFIHFSHAHQVAETARRHFSGQDGLMLLAVDARALGADLKDEPSRGGDLFPHLYASLAFSAILWTKPMPLGPDGYPQLPAFEDV
jgi:uncharacterized protein (DUF952 family)